MTTLMRVETDKHGVIGVEQWPEGLVLWVGGTIVWREWSPKMDHKVTVTIDAKQAIASLEEALGESE